MNSQNVSVAEAARHFARLMMKTPTESMGARGRLTLLWGLSSGQLASSPILNDRIFSCMLCGACSGLCPLEIDIKEVIYHGRSLLKKTDKKRRYPPFPYKVLYKKTKIEFQASEHDPAYFISIPVEKRASSF